MLRVVACRRNQDAGSSGVAAQVTVGVALETGRIAGVRLILGHKSLEMTMKVYAKMNSQIKRQAVGRLSYGKGSQTPEHLVQLRDTRPFRVQFDEKVPTADGQGLSELPQVIAAQ